MGLCVEHGLSGRRRILRNSETTKAAGARQEVAVCGQPGAGTHGLLAERTREMAGRPMLSDIRDPGAVSVRPSWAG